MNYIVRTNTVLVRSKSNATHLVENSLEVQDTCDIPRTLELTFQETKESSLGMKLSKRELVDDSDSDLDFGSDSDFESVENVTKASINYSRDDISPLNKSDKFDHWSNSSIREKADIKFRNVDVESNFEYDNWDDDFDVEEGTNDGTISIPESLQSVQLSVLNDASNLKRFSLHVEDTKILLHQVNGLRKCLEASYENEIIVLDEKYKIILSEITSILNFSDTSNFDISDPRYKPQNSDELNIIVKILNNEQPNNLKIVNTDTQVNKPELNLRFSFEGKLIFDVSYIPMLIKHLNMLKQHLEHFINELQNLRK